MIVSSNDPMLLGRPGQFQRFAFGMIARSAISPRQDYRLFKSLRLRPVSRWGRCTIGNRSFSIRHVTDQFAAGN
jgi:hypothetical protein